MDAEGRPIALKLTEGQAHDGRSASDMLDGIGAGQILLADRAYDSDRLREDLAARGAWANVRPMPNRVNLPAFSAWLYRQRNQVERVRPTLSNRWRSRPHSTNSNTTEPSQPDTTSATTISSPPSSSLQSAYGCEVMSR